MTIKCVHLLSRTDDEREIRSIKSLLPLPEHGIKRLAIINRPWTGNMPEPRPAADRPFVLTKGHYGCYKAHKDAITEHLHDVDALLVCECDCLPIGSMSDFVARVRRAAEACIEGNLDAFTLGYRHGGKTIDTVGSDVIVINQWISTHCYVVPLKSRELFLNVFSWPFDAYDFITTCYLCDQLHCRIGAFADRPAATQADGTSLISGLAGSSEEYYRNVRH